MPMYPEIEIRSQIAIRIKNNFYADQEWPKVYMEIAKKISHVLKMARLAYPDKEEIDFLNTVSKCDDQMLEDLMEMNSNSTEGKNLCKENQPSDIGKHIERCMEKI